MVGLLCLIFCFIIGFLIIGGVGGSAAETSPNHYTTSSYTSPSGQKIVVLKTDDNGFNFDDLDPKALDQCSTGVQAVAPLSVANGNESASLAIWCKN